MPRFDEFDTKNPQHRFFVAAAVLAMAIASCQPSTGGSRSRDADGVASDTSVEDSSKRTDVGRSTKDVDDANERNVVQRVRRAVANNCSKQTLQPLHDAELEEVVRAIEQISNTPTDPLPNGVTRGIPLPNNFQSPAYREAGPTFDVLVPDGSPPDEGYPALLVRNYPYDEPETAPLRTFAARMPEPTVVAALDTWARFDESATEKCGQPAPGCERRTADRSRAVRMVLRELSVRTPIDRSRVWATGASFNGSWTWNVGAHRADAFSAIVPVSTVFGTSWDADLARNLGNLPVRVIHGAQDENTPIEPVRRQVKWLNDLGLPVRLDEYPDEGHSTMFPDDLSKWARWALKKRRKLLARSVHLGVYHPDEGRSSRWLEVGAYQRAFFPVRDSTFTAPEAMLEATWKGNVIHLSGYNLRTAVFHWRKGPSKEPATGQPGDRVHVEMDGEKVATVTLKPNPLEAIRAFCRTGDANRTWAGSFEVKIPDRLLEDDPHTCEPSKSCHATSPYADCCVSHEHEMKTELGTDWCDREAADRIRSIAFHRDDDWNGEELSTPLSPICRICALDQNGEPTTVDKFCRTRLCQTGQCKAHQAFRNGTDHPGHTW